MTTAAPATTPEMEVAKKLVENINTMGEGLKSLTEKVGKLEGSIKDFDGKAVLEHIEKLKTGQETIEERIANQKNAHWFPGIADARKKFSITRAFVASKTKNWDEDAPYEKEVIEEARKAAEAEISKMKGIGKGAGHAIGAGSGAPFVPDQMLADVIGPIYTRSIMVALDPASGNTRCTLLDGLFGMPVKIPRWFGGAVAYWLGEEDTYVETKVKGGLESMSPKKLGVLVSLTDEMRRFTVPAFDSMLKNDMIRGASKKLDWTMFYGTGTDDMPLGLANMLRYGSDNVVNAVSPKTAGFMADGTTYKPGHHYYWAATKTSSIAGVASDGTAGAEGTFDTLTEARGILEDTDLEPDDSWMWFAPARYWRRLKQIKVENYSGQTSGQPYILGAPMLTDAKLAELIGPFDKSAQLVSDRTINGAAKFGDVFGGNWKELLFGRWSGVEIEDDAGKGKGFTNDQMYVKLRVYCDIGHREERNFVRIPDVKMRD